MLRKQKEVLLPDFWLWRFLPLGCLGRTCWKRTIWNSLQTWRKEQLYLFFGSFLNYNIEGCQRSQRDRESVWWKLSDEQLASSIVSGDITLDELHHVWATSSLCASLLLTARLGRWLVSPRVVKLPILLLRQAQPLLLYLVDFLLSTECITGHGQVLPQHCLLLPLPLGPRVLQLSALWKK